MRLIAEPAPIPMPAHNGIGLNDHQRRFPFPSDSRQHNPKESIPSEQSRTRQVSFEDAQLLAQGNIF